MGSWSQYWLLVVLIQVILARIWPWRLGVGWLGLGCLAGLSLSGLKPKLNIINMSLALANGPSWKSEKSS